MRTPLLILLCCFTAALAQAQGPSYYLGALGGGNVTTRDSDMGWNAGAIGLIDLGKHWMLQGQLAGLAERNVDEWRDYSIGDPSSSYSYSSVQSRRSWIELSTVAAFHPQLGSKVGALMGVGFSTRLLLQASIVARMDAGNHQGTNSGTSDMTEYMYRWNYGIPLQLGMDFKVGKHKVAWLLEYHLPLRNLYKPAEPSPSAAFDYSWVATDVRYQSVALKLAYILRVK